MPQSGFTPIQLYRSSTASNTPSASDLQDGELAINTADEKLFFKNSSGVVKEIASSGGSVGDVAGPASATDGAIVAFDGTTGKLVKSAPLTANNVVIGNGTGAPNFVAPGTSGNVLKSDGTTWTSAAEAAGFPTPTIVSVSTAATSGQFLVAIAGSITITLPATPTAGDFVVVKDGTGAAATTTFTVARNGSNIASSATDLTFDKNFAEITMTYMDATIGWSV
tara:strand:- start:2037 stop:2705 length:669 start_codon:yes stop_codon:yes gene_type:complete